MKPRLDLPPEALIGALPDPVFVIGRDGTYIDFHSPPGFQTYVPPEQFLGRRAAEVMPPEVAAATERSIEAALRTGKLQIFDYRLPIGGSFRDFEARLMPAGPDRVLAIIRDVTDQRRAVEALQHSEARFRSMIENSPDAIGVTKQGVHLFVNAAFRKMFGYRDNSEILGRSVLDLLAPSARPFIAENIRRRAARLSATDTFETRGLRADGAEFDLDVHVSPYEEDGEVHTVVILRDITAQKQLEEQYRHSQKMEAAGRLAGGIAHDFNNVLTIITGYARMVLDVLPPESPARADTEEIMAAAERAAALTTRLLAFSRRQPVKPKVLDINHVATDAARLLRRALLDGIEVRTVLTPSVPPIEIDPGALEQVIMNLAVNAGDAMNSGGTLTLETAALSPQASAARHLPRKPHVMLAIADTGHGMTKEVRNHLFEPFFTTKEKGKGTGLGLPTVYAIVKQAGGEILVWSEPGQGSIFRVFFPAVGVSAERGVEQPRPAAPESGKESILLVEDQAQVRRLTAIMLQRYGYRVVEAASGEEAIETFSQSGPFDLLVTDVIMPGVNGREMAQRLVQRQPGLKVLYISGFTNSELEGDGQLPDGVRFLQKPFTRDDLARAVRGALDGSVTGP